MKLAIQQLVASYGDKKEEFESVLRKLSQSVLNQIESLSQIATEFSSFAKMPSIRIESFDITSVVNDIINLFADESIEISVEYENESLTIEADQSQFKRMIINMIRNSIQAEAGRILIKVSEQNGMINLLISDNGNGISQEIQNKIFESNFTTKDKGMGLGLKLSKRFLEQIQGDIKLVHSSAGKTEFLILIPISSKTNIQPVS
jgi:signal transduction histidine kinase